MKSASAHAQSVLVADDDPAIHAIFRRLLKPLGVRLISCKDGNSACEQALAQSPEIIFLDVVMPGMDGTDLCRKLRETPATAIVPIILLSSLGEPTDRLKGLEAGANDYLVKPIALPEVVAKVRTYLQLSMLHRKAIEIERRRAVTGLLRGLAHQFNNILCGLSGSAQVLDRRLGLEHPAKEQVKVIVQYSQRAATISQQLLVLAGARHDLGSAGSTELSEAIRSAWESALTGMSRNHQMVVTGAIQPGVRLKIGEADLQACLFHVLQNALRASTPGGEIRVQIQAVDASAIRLDVSDLGCGMSEQELAKSMEPFHQNWGRPTEAGLGLPFVRALMEDCGGSLDLTSAKGQGTTVSLRIPVDPGSGSGA
ncbi:MAG: hybrid sensor histidine kinase/response regulator [Fibrobacterota bacterium]|nr:hybrid sensor histidine kinase/response regulator [Fibrobacterota bacterium]QQS03736.1 MAG: hybrid sensor histidine kinase/response regulator [Fibrobacterota bacterium]